jgi:hypothetical protein
MTDAPSPTWDPLGYNSPLPLRSQFFPLGFPLEITTNSQEILVAATTSWPETEGRFSAPKLHMRVLVTPAEDSQPPPPPQYRAQGHFLSLVADPRHVATCDFDTGTAACWISSAIAADHAVFRYHYLEGIVYSLLSYQRLTPVHASCVASGERGVLLSGPPGTGKSCLACACARAGLRFVSDDVAYLLRGDSDSRLVGRPRFLRLRPSALELFPDLRGTPLGADVGGEPILEVQLDKLNSIRTTTGCLAAATVFLNRQANGPAVLSRAEPQDALDRLVRELPVIAEAANREQVASLQNLVQRGAYRLSYSDLDGAVQRIRELVRA